ncbi:MAG: excinuclease ABC subunit B [Flavobacteriales bacterium]|nr:excinuclease ABC subunit UvrB [Bacteroidales bacterium AH-315-I05]PCJ82971.1 MAG: excinuclease ABC subunit B [Flavobacteriales bacterium]
MQFQLTSSYQPTGDQPQAIQQLEEGIGRNDKHQTLLGVTGSGKTFTIANVIQQVQKPTLVFSHNKTLAAQLYGEFKQFFPNNAVEYFVSYYDYYQPEAYMPVVDKYIEKDLAINDEIEKLRLSTISSLLSGRRDVIVVSSVSCIYGIGNPKDFNENIINIKTGQTISRNKFLHQLVSSLYSRTQKDLERGTFRVRGDTIDIYLAYADYAIRVVFWGDEIEEIAAIEPGTGMAIENHESVNIYPANIFVTTQDTLQGAIRLIQDDLIQQLKFLKETGRHLEAKRLEDRVNYDMEMMRELGYCSGIENYSRYFDGRNAGERSFCLLDYFPDDFLMVIDESHVTIPQIRGMYGGDRSRKVNLVEYGFRLPAALDNRPLKFEEFETLINQVIYVSATPAEYELQLSEGIVVEQVVRPTGLLDPEIEVRPVGNQIDDLLEEVAQRIEKKERVLVTTLTKRMAEELAKYMANLDIKCRYIHSEVDTFDRVEILRDLRMGIFDVLIGINLLREGLDLPEVSLVAILDADKEGFLRSERSLTQTAGRAARNINGKVIMYADKITNSMKRTIDETERRRIKQLAYNEKHNITPTQIVKSKDDILRQAAVAGAKTIIPSAYVENETVNIAADPVVQYMSKEQLEKTIEKTRKQMQKAAKEEDFMEAARLRDEMSGIRELLKSKQD